jgi:hypothetical protein
VKQRPFARERIDRCPGLVQSMRRRQTGARRVGAARRASTFSVPAVADIFKAIGLSIGDFDFVFHSDSHVLDGRRFLGAFAAPHHNEEDGFWAALNGVTKIASSAASVALLIAYSKPPEAVAEQRGAPPLVTHSKTGTWVEGE